MEALLNFFNEFKRIMIEDNRFDFIITGLKNTFIITLGALAIGIVIGILVAAVRTSFDKNKETLQLRGGIGYFVMIVLNTICKIYLTVIRGTPVVVQLMIFYFIIFKYSDNGVMVAITAFGLNSGAYVAEIFRAGIMSIDHGQFEAGRSLGFNYFQTMRFVVIPQMFKAVLPTLCNEFIVLLKETSVAGYVGVIDLTKAGNTIAGRMYSYFIPLFLHKKAGVISDTRFVCRNYLPKLSRASLNAP